MASRQTLTTNHVNYLVLRYLQECGYEKAARALYRDWERPRDLADPESLPFAPHVKHQDLINIIQDGLHHDRLVAEVSHTPPRFELVSVPASSSGARVGERDRRASASLALPHPITSIPPPPSQPSATRPAISSSRRKSSQSHRLERDEFAHPPAKRARTSNGPAAITIGPDKKMSAPEDGDEMDIDSSRMDHGANWPQNGDTDMSEIDDVVIDVSSSSTQTDRASLRAEASYLFLDNPDSSILHVAWNPRTATASRLVAVGEALCRLYDTSTLSTSGAPQLIDADLSSPAVTAASWHPKSNHLTCALESPVRQLVDVNGKQRHYQPSAPWLEDVSVTLALRHNSSGSLVLSLSTDMERAMLEVWAQQGDGDEAGVAVLSEPVAVKLFDRPVLDAQWMSDDSIVVCGQGRVEMLTVVAPPQGATRLDANGDGDGDGVSHEATTTSMSQSRQRDLVVDFAFATEKQWDKLCVDEVHRLVAVSSMSDDCSILLSPNSATTDGMSSEWTPLMGLPVGHALSMAFCPAVAQGAGQSDSPDKIAQAEGGADRIRPARLLAVVNRTGTVGIYSTAPGACRLCAELSLGPHEAALAVAWSPKPATVIPASLSTAADGAAAVLAVATDEAVRIYDLSHLSHLFPDSTTSSTEADATRKAQSRPPPPPPAKVTWRAAPTHWYSADENNLPSADDEAALQPLLAWDASGVEIVFAVHRKIAVLRLAATATAATEVAVGLEQVEESGGGPAAVVETAVESTAVDAPPSTAAVGTGA